VGGVPHWAVPSNPNIGRGGEERMSARKTTAIFQRLRRAGASAMVEMGEIGVNLTNLVKEKRMKR